MQISVDLTSLTGPVKPLHGTGNLARGRSASGTWFRDLYLRAGIPFCRLHDTEYPYGSGSYVDIHCIFPDFDRDPQDPDAYFFRPTDLYMQEIAAAGARAIYRLGESIDHTPRKSHVFPPRDPEKWASVCEHIIAHYTEGWNKGFHMDCPYWEIWNEPDNEPELAKNPMWQGAMEQYFELYRATSTRLKARFPHLKIGGYGSCGFYAVTGTDVSTAAASSPRLSYFIDFAKAFLSYITDPAHPCPLDFFSWHSYADDPEVNRRFALCARDLLDSYGLTACESMLNEWNPRPLRKAFGKAEDAAAVLANMIMMQQESVDVATYYDGQPSSTGYCSLFDRTLGAATAYNAMEAFGAAYRLGTCASSHSDLPLYALGASDGAGRGMLLVANCSPEPQAADLTVVGGKPAGIRAGGDAPGFFPCPEALQDDTLQLKPWQILWIDFE